MSIVILLLVSLIITLPVFLSSGLMATHDIFLHLIWSEQFHKAFIEGVFYPRWVDTPFGYGTPTFIFYAPLSFYVMSLINIFTNSSLMSMKIAIYLSFFLSGLSMYLLARDLNGKRAGLVSGVLYQFIPYHIFDLFCRGDVPELFAFIWFPLILLFIRKIFTERKFSSIAFVSLAYAGLILTHLVSAFMFTFVMVGYGLYLSLFEKERGILRMLCAIALGLGLSSIYLMPVIFERGFIHIESIMRFDYRDNFLMLNKKLTRDPLNKIVFITSIDVLFLIIAFILFKIKLLSTKNVFFVLLLTVSILMITPLSLYVWMLVPGFSNLQFPWRWLLFSGISISIVVGDMVINLKGKLLKAIYSVILLLLSLSLFIMFQPKVLADIDFWRQHSGAFSPVEYRPIWIKEHRKVLPAVEKVTIINGKGSVEIVEWKSNKRVLLAYGDTSFTLRFSTFYFPGWIAKVDGKNCGIIIEKDSGSMIIEVPEGKHKVELSFEDTPTRYFAKIISFSSVILISSICLHGILKRPKT